MILSSCKLFDSASVFFKFPLEYLNLKIRKNVPLLSELFEGDIVMNSRLRRAVLGSLSKRSALLGTGYKWPGGLVPYETDSSLSKKF